MDDDAEHIHAPELEGGTDWLNCDRPLRFDGALRGKVVLLDFWTYCCINCIHVLEDLRRLERKWKGPLVVVGVHSAKFSTEKDTGNVREAVLRHHVEHPVLCDPERTIWSAYTVHVWPTLVLVDPAGYIVGAVTGEGHHDLLDQAIGDLVETHRARATLDATPLAFPLERAKEGAAACALSFPGKIVADAEGGRLFVADSGNHRVVVATLDGRVTDVAGNGAPGAQDGAFAAASFRNPQGMALLDGVLYVADTDNHLVRQLDLARRTVATLAGTGAQARVPNQAGNGRAVALNSPWDLAALAATDPDGSTRRFLFVAMAGAHQLWCLDLAAGAAFPFAGSGREGIGDGPRHEAWLAQPSGLALVRRWLFVADSEASALRCIDLEDDTVSTAVGRGLFEFGDVDGGWEEALFQHPLGIAADGPRLWVADTYNHKLKRVDLEGSTVRAAAGDGLPGFADGRPGRLREPGGVAVARGLVYVADTNNHAVRVFDPIAGTLTTLVLRGLAPPVGATAP